MRRSVALALPLACLLGSTANASDVVQLVFFEDFESYTEGANICDPSQGGWACTGEISHCCRLMRERGSAPM